MSREMLKSLIEYIPTQDIDTIYRVIVKFIPEDIPEWDEVEAIKSSMNDNNSPKYAFDAVNWD